MGSGLPRAGAGSVAAMMLDRIARAEAFALLCRGDRVEVLTGAPLPDLPAAGAVAKASDPERAGEVVAALPYRAIAERGLPCVEDGARLLAFAVAERAELPLAEALAALPREAAPIVDGRFETSDDEYAAIVRDVIAEDIGRGT